MDEAAEDKAVFRAATVAEFMVDRLSEEEATGLRDGLELGIALEETVDGAIVVLLEAPRTEAFLDSSPLDVAFALEVILAEETAGFLAELATVPVGGRIGARAVVLVVCLAELVVGFIADEAEVAGLVTSPLLGGTVPLLAASDGEEVAAWTALDPSVAP